LFKQTKTHILLRQHIFDVQEMYLKSSSLVCPPGECVLQRTAMVRKKLTAREGRGWLSGTLFCTHFRVAFVPQDNPKTDDNADPILLGDHDIALPSIEKVVAVGPNRTKLVTPNSSLKFTPEELVLYCRDMRVMCFLFDRLTPDAQVIEITYTIAKTYQPLKPESVLSFQNAALGSVEMKQFLSNRRRDSHMNWFESASDWEQELERCGATSWRVSSVNDRFEMSTSLSRFIVVPHKVLDTELKKSFAHFNEGRIPRWCWRHPRGSDLLRMSSFQNNIYHEKDDLRNLEMVLFGCQSSLCVVVELGEELPSPPDIQLAHSRLRALCLGDISTSVSVPDDKWLSTLESTHWLDYIRSCLRKASEVSCLLRSGHLTVALQEVEDRDMSCVVSSLVQVMCDPHCRTQHGFQGLVQKEWVMAGHRFCSRVNYHRDSDKEEAPVFLLFLDCVWHLWSQFPSRFQLTDDFLLALHDSVHLPLFSTFLSNCQRERCKRSQNVGQSYTPVNGWRDMLSPDSSSDPSDPPLPPVWDWALQYSRERQDGFSQPVCAARPLQPLLNGNLNTNLDSHRVNLLSTFKSRCRRLAQFGFSSFLLTGFLVIMSQTHPAAVSPQAFSHPVSANRPHPVDRLAQEVQRLKDQLTQVSSSRSPDPLTMTAEPQRTDANLNLSSNNSTFLYSALKRRATPPPTSTNQHTSRGPSSASAPPPRPTDRDGNKHSFLFGHSAAGEARSEPRYHPPPSTTKLPKSNGPSLTS
uniref:Myotubularin related protein 11 n=1 Tax=Fundulus heteroclitus TaxID=8078 RepID=A0A3Q2QMN0_FUNHE